MSKRADFILFFILMYVCNLCLTGGAYTYFYLSKSLTLMHATANFTIIVLALPRIITILGMWLLRRRSDTISKQKMSLITAIFTLISFAGLTFAQGKVWFVLFALLYGFTIVGQGYLSAIVLDHTAPEDRIRIFGYFATSASLSSLFGASLTELFYPLGVHGVTHPADFPSVNMWGFFNPLHMATDINPNFMMITGVILSIVWIITNFAVRSCEKRIPFYGVVTQEDKDFIPRFWDYKIPMGMTLLLGILWMSLMSLVPGYALYLDLEHSSLFFTGFAILAVLGRFLILPKMPQWGRRNVLYACFFCYCLSLGSLLFLTEYPASWLLFVSGLLCGLGHGVLFTTYNVIFTEVTPKHTGNASFVFFIIFFMGCIVVMPLGTFVDMWGYTAVLWGLLVGTLVYTLATFFNKPLQKTLLGLQPPLKR